MLEGLAFHPSNMPEDDATAERVGPKIRLVPNSLVNIEGKECVVERRLKSRWHFLAIMDREPLHYSDAQLAELMAAGSFFVISQPGTRQDLPVPTHPLNIGEDAHKENMRKLDYVQACKQHPDYCRSRRVLNPILEDVEKRRKKDHPEEGKRPCISTVLSWIDRYEKYGATFGAAALSGYHERKGRRGERLAEYQIRAIEAGIEIWLKRNTKANAYQTVLAEVLRYDREGTVDKAALDSKCLDEDGSLKPPSPREFERRCDRVDPMVRDAMRIGVRYVRKNWRTFGTNALPDTPYQEVEVDHCTLDLLVKHPNGVILGRPDLVAFRDRATSLIIGWGLSFEHPSYASFLQGLKSTVYGPDLSAFPNIKNKPDWFGRIQNLFHDNAMHVIGNSMKAAAMQLGINLVQLEPRAPWLKGALERFFGQLNSILLHPLPGTTLKDAVARRDYETLGRATLTFEQLDTLLTHWICDDYNARPTKAQGFIRGFNSNVSPIDAWNAKRKEYETDVLPPREFFIALAGQTVERTIQRNGITVDHIIYEGPGLARVIGHPKHKRRGQKGGPTSYKVARDPHNLGHIYLINHHAGERIEVKAVAAHSSYAEGLTLVEHEIVVAKAREIRKKKKPNFQELVETKAELNAFAAGITNSGSFKSVQRKLAAWLHGNRVREHRSKIESFADDGTDYLAAQPTQTATVVIADEDSAMTTPVPIGLAIDGSALNGPDAIDDVDDDLDISELSKQKAWE